ncbi:MAG: hypothetical protein UX17_C0014G0007 [Parcubacteria group bacterium GW2011_GWC2_45_7]|nr:MAG: hypothetical protein UX17_C0014G0007 [Parcubacteria group bacterium GW2011_GWC2_45_7]KKU74035.1 MAG: hypothetical protein UX98_C0002G0065 [Parcubacteria group bacterium GW2011_GWA2_47_26]
MLKRITKSAVFALLGLNLVTITNQLVLAQSRCVLNGQEVPCEELAESAKGMIGWGIGLLAVIFVVGIAATIFWLLMIVHAASHPIENRAMWIILMVLTGVVGALIYYFVVKRKFNGQLSQPTVTR